MQPPIDYETALKYIAAVFKIRISFKMHYNYLYNTSPIYIVAIFLIIKSSKLH